LWHREWVGKKYAVAFAIDQGEDNAMIAGMKVAFISGTSIVNSDLFASWEVGVVETLFGPVTYKRHGEHVLINRHGYGVPMPPHSINYRANIRALADLGFVDVVSVNSVGSLKPELPPGTLVSCGDYVCLQQGPQTFFDDELKGGAPGIDNNLMPMLLARLSPEFSIFGGKVYVQMQGPRFETKAEIEVIRHWGDVVGMTAAHEADLCREIGLHYNSFAIVDNYANGLAGSSIDFVKFKDLVKDNQAKANRLFARLLEILH
jgi:5'-methylthioadenosine phosphorylase